MPEFYVGYLPIPSGLKRIMRRVVAALGAIAAGTALVLVVAQGPFPPSTFDYGAARDVQGVLITRPYPALATSDGLPWLLVGAGKHGFLPPSGLEGRVVRVHGERILRGSDRAITVQSLTPEGAGERPVAIDLGAVELTGEIVDSKCYFGVMNPGNGKVHRDCAVRCLSGGLPPALVVRDAAGETQTVLIANWRRELLDHVAEPVTLRGHLSQSAGRLILYTE